MVGRLARRPTYAEFTSRILEGWEACWGLVERRWAFCFLGSASRLLSHRWGTVKLDDCNLPGQNSERNHLRLAFEQGHSIGRAAESTQAAFPLAMRVGRCKPRPHKRPRSKSSGLEILKKNREAIEHERAITEFQRVVSLFSLCYLLLEKSSPASDSFWIRWRRESRFAVGRHEELIQL
jgi:hypothetical protein